ncbi:fimbrial protein [Enterobacter sichuanensis]
MKKIITLFATLLLTGWSINAWAFSCKTNAGATIPMGGGSASVYITLPPTVEIKPLKTLAAIDLSQYIFCRNDDMSVTDTVTLMQAIDFRSLKWSFSSYMTPEGPGKGGAGLPIYTENYPASYWTTQYSPWRMWLNITPTKNSAGKTIPAGQLMASVIMKQTSSGSSKVATYTWNLYASNTMTATAGACDVSARDVTVTLPEYPGETTVPVTVRCGQSQTLSYYLSGTTSDSVNTIFTNTASGSPAQGIGIQMLHNGVPVPANQNISLGTVGSSPVNLGLTATYARTSGQVTAGNVQSIIGVTFVYQ